MGSLESETTTVATLNSLEHRLQQITFYLTGEIGLQPGRESDLILKRRSGAERNARTRLANLEDRLARLSSEAEAVRELLQLQSAHPNLLPPQPVLAPSEEPSPEVKQTDVLVQAPLFASTSSQLQSLNDLTVPSISESTFLIALHPRLTLLEEEQQRQNAEIAELRERTAHTLQRWYEISVLGSGECWEEWEGRMSRVEQKLRREEVKREKEA